MQERIKNLRKALLLEKKEALKRYSVLLENRSMAERIHEGITLYPVGFSNETYSAFEELILEFSIHENQDPYKFSANGKAELFNGNNQEKISGTIVKFKNGILSFHPRENELPDWIKEGKLGLNALPDTRTTEIQIATLDKIEKGELRIAHNFYQNPSKEDYEVPVSNFEDFNPSQNEAIGHLLSKNPFHIIHGPPGTGKTKTISKAILELASLGKRILVAAPSNAAVDHITRELSQQNLAITRVGGSFKISEDILPYTLKHKVLNHSLKDVLKRLKKESEVIRKKAFQYKRNFGKEEYLERKALRTELREIRKEIRNTTRQIASSCVEQSAIVTGTFMGLQDKLLETVEFDAVFVDEAGQALEPAVWSVAHFSPHLFLAGDPLQLPPTLFSNEAQSLGLSKSLIEKGITLGIPTSLLNVQYRMNKLIMQFSNEQFYEGKLTTADTVAEHVLLNEAQAAIEFIDTAGCGYDEKNYDTGGILNEGEALLVVKRLQEFEQPIASFGIISPYRQQVIHLQELLPDMAKNCQTIDSFQGQERDLIILSLVRSNESSTIGFLKDYRRMNVAMTRARKKLIVIADSATIGQDGFYQDFLTYIENKGSYRSGWEFMD